MVGNTEYYSLSVRLLRPVFSESSLHSALPTFTTTLNLHRTRNQQSLMYTLGNRFASAREVKELRDRNTKLENDVADLAARLSEIERQCISEREDDLKERELILAREREAQRKFSETERENPVLRGQLAVLERVLTTGAWRLINGQGGQLGGELEQVRDAAGSDGGRREECLVSGAGAITHSASSSVSVSATETDTAYSSDPGSLKLGRSGHWKPIDWSWLFWTMIDKFFFNGVVGFVTNWGAARTSAMSDPNLAEDLAVTLGKVLLEANNGTVTTTAVVTNPTLVSHLLILYFNPYVS